MFLLMNIVFAIVLKKWFKRSNWREFYCFESFLSQFNSFSTIIDSKFTGLMTFMISNYFTGILNIFFNLHLFSFDKAIFCLCLNSFLSSLIAYTSYKIGKKMIK